MPAKLLAQEQMQDQVNALMRSRIQAILDQCQWNSTTPLSQYYANVTQEAAQTPLPATAPLPVAAPPEVSKPAPKRRTVLVVLALLLLLLLAGVVCMLQLPKDDDEGGQRN